MARKGIYLFVLLNLLISICDGSENPGAAAAPATAPSTGAPATAPTTAAPATTAPTTAPTPPDTTAPASTPTAAATETTTSAPAAKLSATSILEGLQFPIPANFQANQFRSPFDNTNLGNASKLALTPLQAYPLTMLRFVGIIEKGNKRFAFILTPDNKVYSIKQGDIIGDHYGKVMNISKQKIDIMEETFEGNSKMQRSTTLQLKEKH